MKRLQAETLVQGESFDDLDGAGATLADKELFRCTFRHAKLADSRWQRCAFEACVFIECDLTRAVFVQSSLRGVTFQQCKLLGVDFSSLALNPEVTFVGSILRYVVMKDLNLRGTCFTDCEMQDAQLVDSSFVDADFNGSDLTGASFSRCELAGADFSAARGVYFEPRQNSAKGAFIAVETAVMIAQAAGLRVSGHDDPPKPAKRKRRA